MSTSTQTWIRKSALAAWSFDFPAHDNESSQRVLRRATSTLLAGLDGFARLREIEWVSSSKGDDAATYTAHGDSLDVSLEKIFDEVRDAITVNCSLDLLCVDATGMAFAIDDAGSLEINLDERGVYARLVIDTDIYAPLSWASDRSNGELANINGPRLASFLEYMQSVGGIPAEIDALSYANQATWTGFSRPFSIEDFEMYLLSKMPMERSLSALAILAPDPETRADTLAQLRALFDAPHRAAEYVRVLGKPATRQPVLAPDPFAGSSRWEFVLPLWSNVVFVVNCDRDGMPWGVGFEGGLVTISDPELIEPWRWTANALRHLASAERIIEEWGHELEVILTLDKRDYRAVFAYGLLQSWRAA